MPSQPKNPEPRLETPSRASGQAGNAEALFSVEELTGPAMTVAEARARFKLLGDASQWHSQPVCACGHYIATHEEEPPHPGTLRSVTLPGRGLCDGYRFAHMGAGRPAGLGDGEATA